MSDQENFVLSASVVSPTDVARLMREIEAVNTFFTQAEIREAGTQQSLPRLSKLLDQMVNENKLNLLQEEHRSYLLETLGLLHSSAPILHISFSVDPPGSHIQKIVYWLRDNVHAQALVTVGLQPNIGAGCVMRTNSKIFDFSLRRYFEQKRGAFVEKMHSVVSEELPQQPAKPAAGPQPTEVVAA